MNILIAGDFIPQCRVRTLIDQQNYAEVFSEVCNYTKNVDYSIVNLEAPVVTNEEAKPIKKTGPNLQCSIKSLEALRYAGFSCVTLANNHFKDFGEQGVATTLENCAKFGIDTVGGGLNLRDASDILYKDFKGERIAIINICENEWSIATEETGGSNPLNPIQNYYKINEAKNNADYVLLIVHGGTEHYNLPTPRMVETYRFFVDAGADVVVNHHQHCFSGYEVYKNKPIIYGTGNFCFDLGTEAPLFWNKGYLVNISFEKQIKFELIPYIQCKELPKVQFKVSFESFNNEISSLNSIISNRSKLQIKFNELLSKKKDYSLSVLEPYKNKVLEALYSRHLIPSLYSHRKKRLLYALLRCEAHRDVMLGVLSQQLK